MLLDPRRLGNAVVITPICTADGRKRARHKEQTTHPSPPASPSTAAGTGAREHHGAVRGLQPGKQISSRLLKGQSSADLNTPFLHTLCSCKTLPHYSDLQDLLLEPCHILAGFPEPLACPAEARASRPCGHASLSPHQTPYSSSPEAFIAMLQADIPSWYCIARCQSSASQRIQRQAVVVLLSQQ